MSGYRPLIGLEIHVELNTKSKMFCQCSADYFGKPPNTNTCPVCLGMPGALPVPNKKAVEWTIRIGKALNCTINTITKFDRKHYFYPDLPKGYQISQYDEPIAVNGFIEIETPPTLANRKPSEIIHEGDGLKGKKRFRIHRVHLEEDTGKLSHSGTQSRVDFNRSGVPLVEIVTEADFDNSDDVKRFLEELHAIVRYLGVADADMDKGSMRLEPNISVRKPGKDGFPPYKVEVKNINSFSYVKKAIEYEIVRQTEILEKGKIPTQETRGYNEDRGITVSQRSKEEAADYRYFPEPDIPPMVFDPKFISSIQVPELPAQKVQALIKQGVKDQVAFTLSRDQAAIAAFDRYTTEDSLMGIPGIHEKVANLIVNQKIDYSEHDSVNIPKVQELLGPKQTDAASLEVAIKKVVSSNAKAVSDYKAGKETVIMFLVGQVMREMRGNADANVVKESLINALE